jgi:hypothetical protein
MESIIQELQRRIADAERRVNDASIALQAADKLYSATMNELHVWRSALDAETRAQHAQTVFAGMQDLVPVQSDMNASNVVAKPDPVQTVGTNKTELIRSLLRQNPAGLTPPQIWEYVADQFKHRPYLYSVLKRLKDHNEVVTRRDKYVLSTAQDAQEVNHSLSQVQ